MRDSNRGLINSIKIVIKKSIYSILSKREVELISSNRTDPKSYEHLFLGWFNNHMTVLLMIIQRVQPRNLRRLSRIENFLFDLEHHFLETHSNQDVRKAFEYLKAYFSVYPNVEFEDSVDALEAVRIIYKALGLDFKFNPKGVSHEEKLHLLA